jgi:signal transduction histidine kinase
VATVSVRRAGIDLKPFDDSLLDDQNIFSLTFAALSYSNSPANRYRYKLEGLERDWNEVGADRRQVVYTTLPARRYTFRVQGATSSGAWSDGVALPIEILPPWWGTWWFRLLSVAGAGALLWMLYLFRLRQLRRHLEERVNERTRIARELHDTLLQSFQGLMLRFQVAHDELPACPAEARKTLENDLDEGAQAIAEGRDAIQGLRSPTVETNDLVRAISSLWEKSSRAKKPI